MSYLFEILDSSTPTPRQAVIELIDNNLASETYPDPCPYIWKCTTPGALWIMPNNCAKPEGFPTTVGATHWDWIINGYLGTLIETFVFYVPLPDRKSISPEPRKDFIFECTDMFHIGQLWAYKQESGTGTIFDGGAAYLQAGPMTWRFL
jgi:hypothetical protein